MTTIVVVKKAGDITIAADTLTKYGSYTNESAEYIVNHEKIFRVGENYIGLSGSATADLAIREFFASRKNKVSLTTPSEIFRVWNELHQILKEEYFMNPSKDNDDSFETSRSHALIANSHGIFGVDSCRFVQEYTKFYAYGSGSEFALGALYAIYSEKNSAEDIALKALQAAAEFDDATGAPFTKYTMKMKASKSAK